jgi:Pentapeptide repeats (9 copies)
MTSSSERKHHTDEKFDSDVSNAEFRNRFFVRLVAKGKRFEKVDFKYSIFDTCYLRDCVFDSCDFTGCRFTGTNLYGSSFTGCKFDYAMFERTIVDNDILDVCCPAYENLKLKFARTLRVNYQSLGDSLSANKAIVLELQATEIHLIKAWNSKESYYRKKYKGWKRIKAFFEWLNFKTLDLIWGNGESTFKLMRSLIIVLVAMTLCDVLKYGDPSRVISYWNSFTLMPNVLFSTVKPVHYSESYLTLLIFTRLVFFGFFMSIVIKRFNRR